MDLVIQDMNIAEDAIVHHTRVVTEGLIMAGYANKTTVTESEANQRRYMFAAPKYLIWMAADCRDPRMAR